MNKLFACGMLALAVMFAGTANAADQFADGAKVTITKVADGKNIHNGAHLTLRKQSGQGALGDAKYIIEGQNNYFGAFKGASSVGTSVGYGDTKTVWVLHKGSRGWSIMTADNEANTVTVNGEGRLELQRNQGRNNQVFLIK